MDLISTFVVLIVTLAAIVVGFYAYGISHLKDIKDNWVKYRCNPAYMPLAGAVGSDIMSNFTHCTMQSVQTYAGFVMDPIFNTFKDIQGIFKYLLETLQFIRQKIAGTTDAFLSITSSVFGKIQNTLGTITQQFGRIRTIMYRVMSIFVVLIHITKTGIQTGTSIDKGPIGEVGRFLCFHPDTPIELYDTSKSKISDIKIGDILAGGQEVTSIMMFNGLNTPMVNIDGIKISGNHKILHNKHWIRCEEHPDAIKVGSIPFLICLNTTSHTIPVKTFLFKDYEETDDVKEFYEDVSKFYMSKDVPALRYIYRSTGFTIKNTNIRMEDGSVKSIEDVETTDRIAKGGQVIGFIVHKQEHPFVEVSAGVFAAPGTMMFKGDVLTTAAPPIYTHYRKQIPKDARCINLLTENAKVVVVDKFGNDFVFLDDQEIPDTTIHDKRDQKVIGS
jgi:hypothetical protein